MHEHFQEDIIATLERFLVENQRWVANGEKKIKESYTNIDAYVEQFKLVIPKGTRQLWSYNPERGIFEPNAEDLIEAQLEIDDRLAEQAAIATGEPRKQVEKLTNNKVKEAIGSITRFLLPNRVEFDPDIKWLACNTCMLNLEDGNTADFSPDFLCTNYIPVNFPHPNPYAKGLISDFFRFVEGEYCKHALPSCPETMQFLNEIHDPKDVDIVLDLIAYSLWREYKYQFLTILVGDGNNGKSTFLYWLTEFLGKHNRSSVNLKMLLTDKFSAAQLYHKLINIDADFTGNLPKDSSGELKKRTGMDSETAQNKYGQLFPFTNYAKLWISCYTLPETDDKSDGYFRRLVIINYVKQFFGDEIDPDKKKKICTPDEFTGMLFQVMERLPRILKYGIRETTDESITSNRKRYDKSKNPVSFFVKDCLDTENADGMYISKKEMFAKYLEYAKREGLTTITSYSFSQKLAAEIEIQCVERATDGDRYAWKDVKFKDKETAK